jgi:hypothetical protein
MSPATQRLNSTVSTRQILPPNHVGFTAVAVIAMMLYGVVASELSLQ